jgi:hypothetical protein
MTLRRHVHLTAWIGLIAMWLVVCVPLVSQVIASARAHDEPFAALCSAVQTTDGSHRTSSDNLAACGYCDLLATHAAMPSVPEAQLTPLLFVAFALEPTLSTRFTPLGAFPAGHPRAPPTIS